MKRPDIKTVEERSSVLKETSEELNRDSIQLRSASLRLRETSKKLVEAIRKNARPRKAAPSVGAQAPLKANSLINIG